MIARRVFPWYVWQGRHVSPLCSNSDYSIWRANCERWRNLLCSYGWSQEAASRSDFISPPCLCCERLHSCIVTSQQSQLPWPSVACSLGGIDSFCQQSCCASLEAYRHLCFCIGYRGRAISGHGCHHVFARQLNRSAQSDDGRD
jgi:hypothetical protein